MVDVVDEDVQRVDALAQTAVDRRPLLGRYDPRYDVERKDFFGPGLVAIDVECDAHSEQRLFRRLLIPAELGIANGRDALKQQTGARPRRSIRVEHLVVKATSFVSLEKHKSPRLEIKTDVFVKVSPSRVVSQFEIRNYSARLYGCARI